MDQGGIPGVSIAIMDHGELTFLNLGHADKEKQLKTDLTTKYEIGSCSKAFTALAILRLEKEGKLNVNDLASDYLPWFHPTYKKKEYQISIQQLLNHTSGIPFKSISGLKAGSEAEALELSLIHI